MRGTTRQRAVVLAGASDESWRVREMSARVVARHQLSDAIEEMVGLRDDENARVREAAERALGATRRVRHLEPTARFVTASRAPAALGGDVVF